MARLRASASRAHFHPDAAGEGEIARFGRLRAPFRNLVDFANRCFSSAYDLDSNAGGLA
jgi:hypothetical protein